MKWHGYTLLELLFSITLFSALLGILFSVFGAVSRAQSFHDANSHLTQAATLAFEPMVRALKSANAIEQVNFSAAGCQAVRGFYLQQGPHQAEDSPSNANTSDKIIAITAEPTFNRQGATSKWVRRVFSVANGQLVEDDYDAIPVWPAPLNSCNSSWAWADNASNHQILTSSDVRVDTLRVRMISPIVPTSSNSDVKLGSPFAQIVLTVSLPKPPKNQIVPPVTLQTTVVPTFTYGEQRE